MKVIDALKVANKFSVGQKVNIYKSVPTGDGKGRTTKKVIGKVLGIYPYFLSIGVGDRYSMRESYMYTEIATTGCVVKR